MQYSDEVIKQELERYRIDDKPVSYDEIALFKKGIENNLVIVDKSLLEFVYGRSWYWKRLMESISLSEKTTPDDLDIDHIFSNNPQFLIGFIVAVFKLCGVPYAKKEEPAERFVIAEPKPVEKPKAKKKIRKTK